MTPTIRRAREKSASAASPSIRLKTWRFCSAASMWPMYLVVAEKQGADWKKISGTIQNDILKEYIAQKEYIYPPAPSMRLVIDTFEFGSRFTPRFNTISISGYHIRE